MQLFEYGLTEAENVLIQPVSDHDLPLIENEIAEIRRRTETPFRLTAVKVENWNRDLSPWTAPAVFGDEDFGDGAAAASPSLWFPGFSAYMKEKGLGCETVYLSLGTREEKTRNPVMRTVGDCARYCFAWMKEQGINCTLEWNPGNHFKEPGLRTAKAFAWVMNHMREKPAHAAEKRNMKKPENSC